MTSRQLSEIPVFRPDMSEAEIEAVAATLRSGWIGAGPRAAEFEKCFAEATGARHAIATSSGTAALQTALAGLGIGPGDEVILPAFTWVSAFQAIRSLGATPVFADIEPDYLTIDTVDAASVITARTKLIIAVHHGGQLADVGALSRLARDHGIRLMDDAAHACGASLGERSVGTLCDVTCFSFNAMKNLATGDGGMITAADDELAQRVRLYRALGIDRDTYTRYAMEPAGARWVYDVVSPGLRLSLNDIAASIGLVQLRRLAELNGKRAHLVARYLEVLADLPSFRAVQRRPGSTPSNHMFTLRIPNRDRFVEEMRTRGISIGVHYIPVHLFSAARAYHRPLPVTEQIWREVVTIPLYPTMTRDEQERVCTAMRDIATTL